jgi:hypothetical protein
MKERIHFVKYKGKTILLEDFSGVKEEDEFIALLGEVEKVVHSMPKKSLLVVVDLTNARVSPRISQASKEATASNTPYVHASAIVGISTLMQIVLRAVSAFASRELTSFATREEAMEWLINR